MKTFKLYLCIVSFFVLSATLVSAQENGEYLKAMEKVTLKMDSAKSVNDYQLCRNQFDRIAQKYSKTWMPTYYAALCNIEIVFMNTKSERNEALLSDAKNSLLKLGKIHDTNQSEANTLWGYYYLALIVQNPEVNGQKYYNDVFSFLGKAITENPENPRPVFLQAFFETNLPSFLQSKRDFCEEMDKAGILFAKEIKSIDNPYWGQTFYMNIAKKCETKQK